jgi:hypothetical protein
MFPHLEELDLGNSFLEHGYEMYGSRIPNIKKKTWNTSNITERRIPSNFFFSPRGMKVVGIRDFDGTGLPSNVTEVSLDGNCFVLGGS